MPGMNDHVRLNRQAWDTESEWYQKEHCEDLETDEIDWAEALSAEADLKLLGDVEGRMVLEFGCGAGQASIALAKRGALCVGVDVSLSQLKYGLAIQKKERREHSRGYVRCGKLHTVHRHGLRSGLLCFRCHRLY